MKSLVRFLLLGLTGAAVLAWAGDQAPPPPPPATVPPSATGAPAPPPGGDIQDFVPSEKISADEAVAFPVDI
jgi:hypothetical protein